MSNRLRRVADERGFTMVSVTLSMMVLGLFAVASWAAANQDIPLVRKDADRKRAYEAAEAGIQWYTSVLQRDSNSWAACATNGLQGVNMKGSRASWRPVDPNDPTGPRFAIELVPQPNQTCNKADPGPPMLGSSGQLTVRATGWANGKQRQIVARFRHKGFLDFMYFTQWETLPPDAGAKYNQTADWIRQNCDMKRASRAAACTDIQFAADDAVNGPLHTEDDSLLVCDSPTFGRAGKNDAIEVARGTQATWTTPANGCSNNPDKQGVLSAPAGSLTPPADNRALKNVATITATGNTCVRFANGNVYVRPNQTNWGTGFAIPCNQGTEQQYPLGANTVIYVDHSGQCPISYDWQQHYDSGKQCGNVAVSGTYTGNVTIGAANDIIVNGDLKASNDDLSLMMGLIASHYVRVYHPITNDVATKRRDGTYDRDCDNQLSSASSVHRIDAAILSTSGSFIVDNWDCGAKTGNLTVNGAIAQYWRGPVGTGGNSSSGTGYIKNYTYNDRLRYSQPPNFLDPVGSSWKLLRTSEQSPVLTG